MELNKLTLDELDKLRIDIENEINNREDGFFYILNIRSFGSVTETVCKNEKSAINICSEYNGDNGIIDVYTNNKNYTLCMHSKTVNFIESEEKYKIWKTWSSDKNYIDWMKNSEFISEEEKKKYENEFKKKYKDKLITEPEELHYD